MFACCSRGSSLSSFLAWAVAVGVVVVVVVVVVAVVVVVVVVGVVCCLSFVDCWLLFVVC